MSKYARMTVRLVHTAGANDPRRHDDLRALLCGRRIVEVEVTATTEPPDDGEDDARSSPPTTTA